MPLYVERRKYTACYTLVSVLVSAVANTIGYWVLGGFLGIVLTLAVVADIDIRYNEYLLANS